MIDEIKKQIMDIKNECIDNIKKEIEEMERKHIVCMDRLDIELTKQKEKIEDKTKGFSIRNGKNDDVTVLGHGEVIMKGSIDISTLTPEHIKQDLHNKIKNVSEAMDKALDKGDIDTYRKLADVHSKLLNDAELRPVQQFK